MSRTDFVRAARAHSVPRRCRRRCGCLAALLLFATATAGAQTAPPNPPAPRPPVPPAPRASVALSELKALGGERYQIGQIVLDKKAHRFTVPGRVAHLDDAALEYLAVSTHGFKAYESLLEVDASGSDFNLACILIGLDAERSVRPEFQFDRHAVEGPLVTVEVTWLDENKKTRRVSADDALVAPGEPGRQPTAAWVYFGSVGFGPEKVFGADVSGALVGFVHDPSSVIERRDGLGIGAYGSVRGNPAAVPAVGQPVELVITATGTSSDAAVREGRDAGVAR